MTNRLSQLAIEDLEKDDRLRLYSRRIGAVGVLAGPRGGCPRLIVRTIILFATSCAAARLKPIACAKSKPLQALSAAGARDSVRSLLDSS